MNLYKKIKNMTIEEMADYLNSFDECDSCEFSTDGLCKTSEDYRCVDNILKQLTKKSK